MNKEPTSRALACLVYIQENGFRNIEQAYTVILKTNAILA